MTPRQFFDLTSEVRDMQRQYYSTRSQETLKRCKALERRLDDEISRVHEILRQREDDARRKREARQQTINFLKDNGFEETD